MQPFDSIVARLEEFEKNTIRYIGDTLEENDSSIISMNVSRIYDLGLRSDGKRIKRRDKTYRTYSKEHTRKKKKLGIYQGHVDLSVTGDYLDDFDFQVKGDIVDVYNDHRKNGFELAAFFRRKYGKIEGLTTEQWADVNKNIITPKLAQKYASLW